MPIWLPDLTRQSGPRYQALTAAIAEAIAAGTLKPGDRLPPRRDLAERLGLSVSTVTSAYVEAERRGLVTGEVGRGTYVLPPSANGEPRWFTEGRPANLIDLSVCRPCVDPLHVERLRSVLAALAEADDFAWMLACRPVIGLEKHRQAAVRWLARLGVAARPEQVVLTNGCAHALTVALATLTEPGDGVATEALTDHGLISLASVLHFRLVPLAIDDHGIVPESFAAACRDGTIKVLVTTPILNNPTVALMPEDRRREIARIARAHHVCIVEDDVFRPLLAEPPPPIAAFAPELTLYVTSFTKAALSGLRTGYLVAPEPMVMRLVARVRTTSWMATPAVAEIAARWIDDGTLAELVAWQRRELSWRQQLVHGLLGDQDHVAHPTGINVWLRLPPPWRASAFVEHARLAGVALIAPEPFIVGRAFEPHAVRLSVGTPRTRVQLEQGLRLVRDLLSRRTEPVPIDI